MVDVARVVVVTVDVVHVVEATAGVVHVAVVIVDVVADPHVAVQFSVVSGQIVASAVEPSSSAASLHSVGKMLYVPVVPVLSFASQTKTDHFLFVEYYHFLAVQDLV
ncbi:ribosome-binding factor A, putative [Babesia ovis]|uniref:Ribosome-binding factor A, putative n=1 Tax=Babesia ovis TaxID=5869 RepID=A0A9W5WUV3_BABOV|nr:ribosome-binding factor A, putative [Babesia ovis]